MLIGIDHRDITSGFSIWKAETLAGQPLVEEPLAPSIASRGLRTHQRFDRRRLDREKQPLEDGEVEPLIFESEGEVTFQGRTRRVAGGKNAPAAFLDDAVTLADGEKGSRQWRRKAIGIDQSAVAGRRRPHGKASVPKNGQWS